MTRISDRKGFTLIELMAVVLILAILAGVALPRFFDYQSQARVAAVKGALGGVRAGIANFYANAAISGTAAYPTLAQLTDGSTMQEDLPENPYGTATNDVNTQASSTAATMRTLVGTMGGWAYYAGGGGMNAIFYANTDTATISENDF